MKTYKVSFLETFRSEDILRERRVSPVPEFLSNSDDEFQMNNRFDYFIVDPEDEYSGEGKIKSFIFLFHGLNERSWDKYNSWAEELAKRTGRGVVMFPLAFHMNRSPVEWSNVRLMSSFIGRLAGKKRARKENLTFANYALSSRIKSDPYRFYISGKQTIFNVCQLIDQIHRGEHPVIDKGAKFDIFAYSIGGLLSQVLLQSDPMGRFSNCRLFMFCAGSVFRKMDGNSRLIMDRESYYILKRYYSSRFIKLFKKREQLDSIDKAFISHIGTRALRRERLRFYMENYQRVKVVSLKQDRVIPTKGIKRALGSVWPKCLEELDFTYKYSHEMPFPVNIPEKDSKEYWFKEVFRRAADFLSKQ